jgi:hypothetical protein
MKGQLTMADCGNAVAVVLIFTISAFCPYQNLPGVRFIIASVTAALYSSSGIRGMPSFPSARLLMVVSIDL